MLLDLMRPNLNMNLMLGTIRKWFSNSRLDAPEPWLVELFSGGSAKSGVNVSPLTALGVSTVWACVNAVSRSMLSMPIHLYRAAADGTNTVIYDHPISSLLGLAPNDEMTMANLVNAVQMNVTLRGNGYIIIVRDGLGRVRELWPAKNQDMQVVRTPAGELVYIHRGTTLRKEQVIHLRGMTEDGILGIDVPAAAKEPIGLAMALQDYAATFFPNAISPTAIYEFAQTLTPEKYAAMKKEIAENHQGLRNAHAFILMHGGGKISRLPAVNNRDSQFLEAKVAQDRAICQVFGVPQIKAGITTDAHYNNVEQENRSYITDTLLPWIIRWEQAMNLRLLTQRERGLGYYVKFEVDGLLRADTQTRTAALEKQYQNGVLNRNEWRALENRNPVPGGELFAVSQNLKMLDGQGRVVQPITEPETESQSLPDAPLP